MGLLDKLFGGDFAARRAEGEKHFEAERWGEAKLAYESAIQKAREIPAAEVDALRERIAHCRAKLVDVHVEAARELLDAGNREAALERIETAADLAETDDERRKVAEVKDTVERVDARADATEEELGEDELWAILSGTWEEEQLDEYEELGDPLRQVVFATHEGRGAEVIETIESLLASAEEPCYLHFEHGRALLQADRKEEATAAFRRFVETLDPDEGGRWRASAHDALARIASATGDDDAAEKELRACVDALPEALDPLVNLSRFLRRRGRADEALETAETAVDLMGSLQPHLPAMRELGLALVLKGEREKAIEVLESAVQIYAAYDDFDFDPEFAVTLAKLHEEAGDPVHAADFHRHLAAGSDRANHFAYNLEAGRLLALGGKGADARRYLARALELANDDEARALVEARIAELGPP